jgi:hypothetical protein
MSTATESIAVPTPHRLVRPYWLTALVLAGLVAILGIWVLMGRGQESAPAVRTPQDVSVDRVENPPGWRHGPGGELIPRPFAPVQPGSG